MMCLAQVMPRKLLQLDRASNFPTWGSPDTPCNILACLGPFCQTRWSPQCLDEEGYGASRPFYNSRDSVILAAALPAAQKCVDIAGDSPASQSKSCPRVKQLRGRLKVPTILQTDSCSRPTLQVFLDDTSLGAQLNVPLAHAELNNIVQSCSRPAILMANIVASFPFSSQDPFVLLKYFPLCCLDPNFPFLQKMISANFAVPSPEQFGVRSGRSPDIALALLLPAHRLDPL